MFRQSCRRYFYPVISEELIKLLVEVLKLKSQRLISCSLLSLVMGCREPQCDGTWLSQGGF